MLGWRRSPVFKGRIYNRGSAGGVGCGEEGERCGEWEQCVEILELSSCLLIWFGITSKFIPGKREKSPKIVLKPDLPHYTSPVPSELKRAQPALIENMEQKAAFYKSAKVSICFPTKTDCSHTNSFTALQFYFKSLINAKQLKL